MNKGLISGLSLGLLLAATAACTPSTPPTATSPTDGRSAYSEVALPAADTLVGDDPQQIALATFGMTDPGEGNFAQEVAVVDQSNSQAVVALTQTGLLDDSVAGMRYRLEFVTEGSQWRLDWAGRQVKCQPNRGSQDWTTDLCR
ncbi:MAG TPA: hypothetical protein IGR64_17940 [Leptolyngbyaceae cyanobacterium M65_K2018_010]|nr:hypothetical protein [Leptolyngbyaceae cyanobacterium M65_K2018_010]